MKVGTMMRQRAVTLTCGFCDVISFCIGGLAFRLLFTAVKWKRLRHIRLPVPSKCVSVQSFYTRAKFVRKLFSDKIRRDKVRGKQIGFFPQILNIEF